MERFEFKGFEFRAVMRDGDPWFVAKDVCDVLGIRTNDALNSLDGDEKGYETIGTPGGDQQVSIINEPGLYSLILRSRKERAREFKRWITHEVLPTIRQSGGAYVESGSQAEFDLTDPNSYMDHLKRVIQIAEDRKAENEALVPLTVGAAGAESRKGGESVWNLRDAVCDALGVDITRMYTSLRLIGAVEQRGNGQYVVKCAWKDILFNTTNEVDGKNYPVGAPRVRPGKQTEFLERVRSAYAFRFGLTTAN